MSFKIPDFSQVKNPIQLVDFMRNIFLRTSRTDVVVPRVIPLPVWDMDSTPSISIPLPADLLINNGWERVTGIKLMIFNDDRDRKDDPSIILMDFDTGHVTPTEIVLGRRNGGQFDKPAYSDDTISRGDLTLWHTV